MVGDNFFYGNFVKNEPNGKKVSDYIIGRVKWNLCEKIQKYEPNSQKMYLNRVGTKFSAKSL